MGNGQVVKGGRGVKRKKRKKKREKEKKKRRDGEEFAQADPDNYPRNTVVSPLLSTLRSAQEVANYGNYGIGDHLGLKMQKKIEQN